VPISKRRCANGSQIASVSARKGGVIIQGYARFQHVRLVTNCGDNRRLQGGLVPLDLVVLVRGTPTLLFAVCPPCSADSFLISIWVQLLNWENENGRAYCRSVSHAKPLTAAFLPAGRISGSVSPLMSEGE
jgi:hypothetical protein